MSRELKRVEAALAHDLNNFLQVIMGNLELLKRRHEFVPEIVDAGLQATRRAAQLADRMVALARLQPPEARRFDVNRLLGELAPLVARTVGDAVRVQLSPAPDLPEAFADPHALHVALLELATNARDAMPAGGRVAIRTAAAPDGLVMIEFADTGIGMPPEKAARALEPPSWADGERPPGLGLHIVAGCMRQAGGRAELASGASGTRVKLYLPAAR
ncbi:MAG TPA: ATP-binding protein [Burkholderiales bacterium]|nr:ATP-binding protein [Burkholderiales bacterium]